MSVFLGPDLSYFSRVYPIENISDLVAYLSQKVGKTLIAGREQTGGRKIRFEDLDRGARLRLLQYVAPDYALLQGYYSPKPLDARLPLQVPIPACEVQTAPK